MRPLVRLTTSSLVVLACVAGAVGQSRAAIEVSPETVETRLSAGQDYSWTSRFEASVDAGVLRVRVGVHLVPAGGVTRAELEREARGWLVEVERLWGGRFALETAAGERYPIAVSVDFRGPDFHHDVVVRPGRGRTDQLDWHLGDSPEVVAHEFGHMLGAHDDYRGGANAPAGALDDPGSIMSANPGREALPRARHLERLRGWFAARSGAGTRVVALTPAVAAPQFAQRAPRVDAGEGDPR